MEQKINLVELLKDCPKGMELDCMLWDNVTFEKVADDGIWIKHIDSRSGEHSLYVYNDGSFPIHNLGSLRTKCVIFPKGKTTWEGFQRPYINGDVIVDKYGAIAIYKQVYNSREESLVDFHCGLSSIYKNFFIKDIGSLQHCGEISSIRLATEEEKRQLFDAIKANGYKWNPETKTLEKLVEPIFKVGDRIRDTRNNSKGIILKLTYGDYECQFEHGNFLVSFKEQHYFELVPNKFDITTLKPFESRVLARDTDTEKWKSTFWGFYDIDNTMNHPYECCGNSFAQCIPYEGNEHLLGKMDDCDDFYKTWE